MADLKVALTECRRILKPSGRLLLLEISRPRSAVARWLIRVYFQKVLPLVARLGTGSAQAELLMRYYWDTIASACRQRRSWVSCGRAASSTSGTAFAVGSSASTSA